ncbi:ferrochelatase [Pasteurellaceae bacterium Macca]|nr:ferrochelatase [Pasteurellaceae bacterium Macca]
MPASKIGVILANLGTPDEPTTPAVKRYLKQFLSDPRVIDLPQWKWQFILNFMVLPKRAPRVAHAYQSIWTEQGSPLLSISRQQQQAVQNHFNSAHPNVIVELAMTYGNPSMDDAVTRLLEKNVSKIIVLPLYPQYSSTTTASVFDAFARSLTQHKKMVPFEFIHHYYNDPLYIKALANSIQLEKDEQLFFSFHGIPKRYEQEGDYYAQHCHQTARLVAERLELDEKQWQLAFQSRFGKEEWLKPYTDETLRQLPKKGIKKVAVVCPGFSADCLETIEEIGEENRENFEQAGGVSYRYIPALNAQPNHIDLLVRLIERKL